MKLDYLRKLIINIYNTIINNLFIITFAIILLLLSINYYIIFIGFIIYIIYLYKNNKTIFIITIILSFLIVITFICIKLYQNYLINNFENNIIGKVIEITNKNTYQKITIKYNIFKIIIKDYSFINVNIGDVIKVDGVNNEIDINHIPNGFNYNKYFYNNLYLYEISSNNIENIKKGFSIYIINDIVNRYLEYFFHDESLIILKGFITGETSSFSDSLNNSLRVNGIIHLFAISGSHITLLIVFFEYLFNKIKINKSSFILNTILLIYLFITKFSISILRAILTYYIKQFCIYKNIRLTILDISSLVFIILIVYNPFYMYNLGFVLSFFATFIIILLNHHLKNINNIKSILIITLFINLFTFPIIINLNNEFNILSIFINIIMILLVEGILIPISFIVFIFPIFNNIYTYIISGFISFNEIISKISYKLNCVIVIGEIPSIILIIYYLLIFFIIVSLSNKKLLHKFIFLFCLILFIIIINIRYFPSPTITFLDLYNGESTLIEYKDEVILIDTGEGINNEVTLFLKSKGIRKIDYLILTHNHSDHNGEAKKIINEFKVTNIIVSAYDNSEFSKLDNTIKIKKNDLLETKNIVFHCLLPSVKSSNENNNSLVLYFEIKNTTFLFTGDIEQEIENQINISNIDILKVAHHGSNSSSSISLLNRIRPKYSIIMSGRIEKYNFPNQETIDKLNKINSIIYCTKDKYSITLKIRNNKCIFSTIK